jgi:hypothetical protein
LSPTIRRDWLGLLLVGYALYALAFIFNSSVVVQGRRYFLLFDDAMISMTYARNLAEGHGAVWFPGYDPVQGYSNPLWMLYMAAIHLLPLSAAMMSLPIQLTGLVLMCGTIYFITLIAERLEEEGAGLPPAASNAVSPVASLSELAPFFAALFTAFYLPLNEWSLRGMEVGLMAFGVTLGVWAALAIAGGARYQWWLFPLLGLLTTVRMDAVVPGVVIVSWLAWAVPQKRRATLVVGMAWIAIFVIAQLLIQKAYYHDWLPNTYYLKLAGIPITRRIPWGIYVLFRFLVGIGFWVLVLIALQLVAKPSKAIWLLVAVVAGQAAYSIYVGGDSWEWWGGANRFLCEAMPLFFALIACSLATFVRSIADQSNRVGPWSAAAAMVALGLFTLLQVNCYQLDSYNTLAQTLLLQEPHELVAHEANLQEALAFKQATTPQVRVAVVWAGIIPYFSGRPPVDLLGKNDRTIANGPNNPFDPAPLPFLSSGPVEYCWPGHTKRDYRYSVSKYSPDLIQKWFGTEDIDDLLEEQYTLVTFGDQELYVKKDSKEVTLPKAAGPPAVAE